MKRIVLVALIMAFALPAFAKDEKTMYSYKDAMALDDAKLKLDRDIKFYFGEQRHPPVEKKFGSFVSNQKTSSVGKSKEKACNWAFLSAMMSLQSRAIREGGNAVIDIESYYKKNAIKSETEFECGHGFFVTGVALRGTVVKLK